MRERVRTSICDETRRTHREWAGLTRTSAHLSAPPKRLGWAGLAWPCGAHLRRPQALTGLAWTAPGGLDGTGQTGRHRADWTAPGGLDGTGRRAHGHLRAARGGTGRLRSRPDDVGLRRFG